MTLLGSLSPPLIPSAACPAESETVELGDIAARADYLLYALCAVHRETFIFLVRWLVTWTAAVLKQRTPSGLVGAIKARAVLTVLQLNMFDRVCTP